ncbi:hypothetical protein PVAG01_02062 [Phlyctema vagabunda]|uniref:Uncharacterized protein n=1 Tax=Phlyctema vagabunda TaxID=108571 RepID=A0ABR4PQT5_9HELO
MQFSISVLAIFLSAASLVAATPIPCTDAIRDLVLRGELPAEACCNYGTCMTVPGGFVNVRGG